MSLKTIKQTVKEVLTEDEKTRSSDKWLVLQTLRKLGFKIYVDYDDLNKMPSFESITRSRRFWQNSKNKLKPTEQIQMIRDIQQNKYKETFR